MRKDTICLVKRTFVQTLAPPNITVWLYHLILLSQTLSTSQTLTLQLSLSHRHVHTHTHKHPNGYWLGNIRNKHISKQCTLRHFLEILIRQKAGEPNEFQSIWSAN